MSAISKTPTDCKETTVFPRIFHPPNGSTRGLRNDLRVSLGDAVAFGGMVGIGETYVVAFVLAIGLGEVTAGLVGSVPLLAGGLMQMLSPKAIRLLGSHKRWVVTCAAIQAVSFVPFIIGAFVGSFSAVGILLTASIYWAAGLATGPAWNTWIGTVVPSNVRPKFFAVRTRASQAAVFLGFLIGGLALHFAAANDHVLLAFAGLFGMAAICRLVSTVFLALQSEPTPLPHDMCDVPLREILSRLRSTDGGRLLVYLAAVQAAVQMAGPFFTPFMLEELSFNYGTFTLLISVAFLAKIVALPAWGRYAQRAGAWKLLWIGGIGIAPLSAGWLVSQSMAWLLVLQVIGGVTWAAYELAFFLLFFESIPARERTSMLTFYNLINTAAWVGGTLIGAAILYAVGTGYSSYLLLFGLSSVCRFLALAVLRGVSSTDVAAHEIGMRTVSVRPNSASLDAPVLPSLPDQVDLLHVYSEPSPP